MPDVDSGLPVSSTGTSEAPDSVTFIVTVRPLTVGFSVTCTPSAGAAGGFDVVAGGGVLVLVLLGVCTAPVTCVDGAVDVDCVQGAVGVVVVGVMTTLGVFDTGGRPSMSVTLVTATATATTAAAASVIAPTARRRRTFRTRVNTAWLGTALGGGGSATSCSNLSLRSSVMSALLLDRGGDRGDQFVFAELRQSAGDVRLHGADRAAHDLG